MPLLQRVLSPVVDVRKEESLTAFLMFAYSFLAMTAYNAIKPLTRSKFISDLGADNIPYVLLAAGFIIGILMAGYAWLMMRLPRRWGLPITQVAMAGALALFWLLFQTGATWVSVMLLCAAVVAFIIGRERVDAQVAMDAAKGEKGVSAAEAFQLLRRSKHLKIIALVISFASVGAAVIEQQLNMAAQAAKGAADTDGITAFLAQVGLWTSTIGFVIQVWLTSKIHRYLGIGFALMVLPVSMGLSAIVMLLNAALWAPGLARVLDQSLRYTVDKTTREILFLPLPSDIKLQAKSFVDVTVDRGAKAIGAILLLVLVKPWGLHLDWQRLSYASLVMVALWIFMSLRAKRGYLAAFRRSIERRDVAPAEVRMSGADLSTIETLVEELSQPDPTRVVYAIDVLESIDKRNLVTPLLLYHEAPSVRQRALAALGAVRPDIATQWVPHIRRMLGDSDAGVRAAAIGALGAIGNEDAATLARPLLSDTNPRTRATAAVALA
ncbi:MAG: MFS transporter, partial [Acidobacteria bacterium]|nr:MFS transporter [Acidobacteriota bacterium]